MKANRICHPERPLNTGECRYRQGMVARRRLPGTRRPGARHGPSARARPRGPPPCANRGKAGPTPRDETAAVHPEGIHPPPTQADHRTAPGTAELPGRSRPIEDRKGPPPAAKPSVAQPPPDPLLAPRRSGDAVAERPDGIDCRRSGSAPTNVHGEPVPSGTLRTEKRTPFAITGCRREIASASRLRREPNAVRRYLRWPAPQARPR